MRNIFAYETAMNTVFRYATGHKPPIEVDLDSMYDLRRAVKWWRITERLDKRWASQHP